MRLKSYEAGDMNEAMDTIRRDLGDEAVILSVIRASRGKGIKVTAASGEDTLENLQEAQESIEDVEQKRPMPLPRQEDFFPDDKRPEMLHTLERVLSFHGVPNYLSVKIIETAKYLEFDSAEQALQLALEATYGFSPLNLKETSKPVVLIGPPGVGKTVTAAKLAAQAVMQDIPVSLITTDTMKAGGVEQLRAFTSILGSKLAVAENAVQLASEIDKVPMDSFLIIDTAGANPYSLKELGELEGLIAKLKVDTVLVLSAGGDVSEAADVARAFTFLSPKCLIGTRVDAARRLGGMLVAAGESQLHFSNIGFSPNVADGLEVLTPKFLANLLIRYRPGYY